jgi:DNA-binding MarR family transcriptional regulator
MNTPRNRSVSGHAERAWLAMRALVFELNDRRPEVAATLGMSFVRVKALRQLARDPMTMGELAEELSIDAPYATLVVDDLEERGLVERRPDPGDRRRKIVAVTTDGLRIAQAAQRILDVPPAALAALPDEDLAALDRIMQAVLANATATAPDEVPA